MATQGTIARPSTGRVLLVASLLLVGCDGSPSLRSPAADTGPLHDGSGGAIGDGGIIEPDGRIAAADGSGDDAGGAAFVVLSQAVVEQTPSSCKVTWTLSDFGTGYVDHGTDQNKLEVATAGEASLTYRTHIQRLEGLAAETTYYWQPRSTDASGNVAQGTIGTCTTKAAVTNPPNANALFVSTSGNDNHSGESEAAALRTIQKGVNLLKAGQTLYVKAGLYTKQTVSINHKGTAAAPYIIEGYRKTPGDNPTIANFNHKSSHDASVMPLLDNIDRTGNGVSISGGEHVVFKNFQVTNFRHGVFVASSKHVTVDNVITSNLGVTKNFYNGHGIVLTGTSDSTLKNSVVVNAVAEAISVRHSENNTLEGNAVYCDDNSVPRTDELHINSATDYYFILSYSHGNQIINNYIERVGDLDHLGHGFSIKAEGQNNLFEGNTAVNLQGGGFVVRHRGVKNNLFRKNTAIKGLGILTRDGASENTFEDSSLKDNGVAFSFMDSVEDGKFAGGFNNLYKNITVSNVGSVIHFSWYAHRDISSYDNVFDNIQVDGAKTLVVGDHYSKNNVVKNSQFKNVSQYLEVNPPRVAADVELIFQNSSCQNCGFTLP